MHHRCGFVLGKYLVKAPTICQFTPLKGAKFDRILPSGDKVVIGHGRVTCRSERLAGMRANVTCAARHKNISH